MLDIVVLSMVHTVSNTAKSAKCYLVCMLITYSTPLGLVWYTFLQPNASRSESSVMTAWAKPDLVR